MQRYSPPPAHVTGRIHRQRILNWWDELLRVAGSLNLRLGDRVPAVQKLQAYPQKNALALALQEYGRLVRTLHILRWYANHRGPAPHLATAQ